MSDASGGEALLVESVGAVRVVTLNRPDTRNAFLPDLQQAMRGIWAALSADREARAVVLTGAGSAFSAGGDFEEFETNARDGFSRRAAMINAGRLVDELLQFPLPLVVAVNGPAVGLGATLVLLGDIVVMAEGAYLADTHVPAGIVAGDGGAALWPLMIGLMRAKPYLLLGDRIDAETAVRVGLATEMVPPGDLRERALDLAQRLAAQPAVAVQDTKRALNLHARRAALDVMPFSLAAESESFSSDEVHDFLARHRPPQT